jgi:hypothetical protein
VDTALLVVTILSLAAALVSILALRRMKYLDQQRSDARVAALAAAAIAPMDDVPLVPQPRAIVNRPSLIVERPSPPAQRPKPQIERAPALSTGRSMFGASLSAIEVGELPLDDRDASTGESFFGTAQREAPASGRFAFVAAAAMLVALGGAVVVFTTSGHGRDRASAAAAAHAPLELVSLSHSRDDNTLTISGTVRNPSGGPKLEGLTAVVSLIDAHGGLISSKDVPLDYRALGPGEEAPFKVTVPDPGSVARYRVSFRAGTDVVPHVDRRSDTKLASAL